MCTIMLGFTVAVTTQKGNIGSISSNVLILQHTDFLPSSSLEAGNKQDWDHIHKGKRHLKKRDQGPSW